MRSTATPRPRPDYGFGDLLGAQAEGPRARDRGVCGLTLRRCARGRPATRLKLAADLAEAVMRLAEALEAVP